MTNSKPVSKVVENFEQILEKLRVETGAGRTTIRLDHPGLGFHVNTPAAESLAQGVHSIKPHGTIDQWNGNAIKWMLRNKRTFIMNDCLNPMDPEIKPHPAVVGTYGIRSEMLAPLIKNGEMFGWISVHCTTGPREWSGNEIKMIESACQSVLSVLENFDSFKKERPGKRL